MKSLIFILLVSVLFVSCMDLEQVKEQKEELKKPFTLTGIVLSKENNMSDYYVGVLIVDRTEYIRVPFNVDFRHGDTLEMKGVWDEGHSKYLYYYQSLKKRKL